MLAVLAAAAFRILPSITRLLANLTTVRGGVTAKELLFDELARLILGRALDPLFRSADAAELAGDLLGRGRVDAEDEIADGRQDQHADPAARRGPAAHAASVLDPAAAPSSRISRTPSA